MRAIHRYLIVSLAVLGLLGAMLVSAAPTAAASFYFKTWAQSPYPQQYSTEVVWVQLCNDAQCNSPIIGAPVHTEWNYRTSLPSTDWYTGNDGKAAMTRNIGDATCGYSVRVDVYVGGGLQQINSAFFTPCYDADARARAIVDNAGDPLSGTGPYDAAIAAGPGTTAASRDAYYTAVARASVNKAGENLFGIGPYDAAQAQAIFDAVLSGGSGNTSVAGYGTTCPAGYPIKANDNSGIYHVPGQQFYDATNARNCFATAAAAEVAGYRASKV